MKCPRCGAEMNVELRNYSCPFCGYSIDKYQLADSQEENNNNIIQTSSTSKNIYQNNIAGVARVFRLDAPIQGSAFVISKNGLLLTNTHVISKDDGTFVDRVKLFLNNEFCFAKVEKYNPSYDDGLDVALLKIEEPHKVTPLRLGDSNKVKPGDDISLIGNPKGEGLSITKGIISDNNRYIGKYRYFLSDCVMNPGNSGGPMFNERGEVIAICVMKRREAEGMGYYIPINDVKELLMRWNISYC